MSLQKTENVAFLSSGASLFNLLGFIKSAEFCWNLLSDTNECCIQPWDNEQSMFMFSFQARQKSNNLGLKLLRCWWNAFYVTLKSVKVSLFMTANEKNVRKYNTQMWGSIDGREPTEECIFSHFISRLCRFLVQCLVKFLSTISWRHTTSMAFQPYPSISSHRLRNNLSLCVLIVPFLFSWEKI